MRDTLIDKLRVWRPDSRIIHELNTAGTGSPRADIACIGREEILLFEIKSERDVLKRLPHQWEAFNACSHKTFLILDKKFTKAKDLEELKNLKHCRKDNIWTYPETPAKLWTIAPRGFRQTFLPTPDTRRTLNLLWRAELIEVCNNLSLPYASKDNMLMLVERIILGATGRQIIQQVCQMLRTRKFANADILMEPLL